MQIHIFFSSYFKSAIYSYFINRGLKERRSASLKIKIHEEKGCFEENAREKTVNFVPKDIQAMEMKSTFNQDIGYRFFQASLKALCYINIQIFQ